MLQFFKDFFKWKQFPMNIFYIPLLVTSYFLETSSYAVFKMFHDSDRDVDHKMAYIFLVTMLVTVLSTVNMLMCVYIDYKRRIQK